MTKYARALALVAGFIAANPSLNLERLLWNRARKDQAFRYALLRIACVQLGRAVISNRIDNRNTSPQQKREPIK